ncbi:hypothetical protein [Photorhabdus aegyptia]|uniref:hypothetical protein n=1 Tax=Photorhabdus aegyptia TaxID=2805098 RepID=UPI000A4F2E87|nr:hypothetical protein [Photorhabdus aegyptia]
MSHSMKEAKQLITDNNEAWRQWSTAFRIRTDALSIPRETLFRVVREGKHHPEFLTDAVAMKEFLNCTLGDTDIPVELPEEKPKVSNYPVSTSEASITDVTPDEVETQQAALQVKEKKSEAKSLKTRKTKQTKEDKAIEETAQDNTTASPHCLLSLPRMPMMITSNIGPICWKKLSRHKAMNSKLISVSGRLSNVPIPTLQNHWREWGSMVQA